MTTLATTPELDDISIAILQSIHRSETHGGGERFGHSTVKEISEAFGTKNHETAKKLQQLWQGGHLTSEGADYSEGDTLKLHKCRMSELGLRTINESANYKQPKI